MKLAALVILLLALAALVGRYLRSIGFSLEYTAGKTAPMETEQQYVTRVLRQFVAGKGHDWDWDDFTSCPLKDPELDRIRTDAVSVPLPLDGAGISELSELLKQAEARAISN